MKYGLADFCTGICVIVQHVIIYVMKLRSRGMSDKLCPLKFNLATNRQHDQWHCMKEECAWWDAESKCCAMLSIVGELFRQTSDITNNMR